jgi:hypothetical protein
MPFRAQVCAQRNVWNDVSRGETNRSSTKENVINPEKKYYPCIHQKKNFPFMIKKFGGVIVGQLVIMAQVLIFDNHFLNNSEHWWAESHFPARLVVI